MPAARFLQIPCSSSVPVDFPVQQNGNDRVQPEYSAEVYRGRDFLQTGTEHWDHYAVASRPGLMPMDTEPEMTWQQTTSASPGVIGRVLPVRVFH